VNEISRLFLTSYQGSGTHQVMPALGFSKDVEDFGHGHLIDIPRYVPNIEHVVNEEGRDRTAKVLKEFRGKLFGHVSYLTHYEDALKEKPTKVLLNVRDPRDIVISEYHKMIRMKGLPAIFWQDFELQDGSYVHDMNKEDAINEFILYASKRWPHWLGWLYSDMTLMVKYENLRTNAKEELNKIVAWVAPYPLPPIDQMILDLIPRASNPTFRKGNVGDWKDEFSESNKRQSNKLLGYIIDMLGYEQ